MHRTLIPLLLLLPGVAVAADHAEAPGAAADAAADIGDLYAWHTGDKLVTVLTFNPFGAAGEANYDADLLYTIHIDSDGDLSADTEIHARFGMNMAGEWGIQVMDLPGADEPATVGAANGTIDAGGGAMVYSGVTDDPFFFDQTGFLDTLSTGTLSFTATDAVAGLNINAIVLEFPFADVVSADGTARVWATTSRLGS
ncbi:MAG: hypothetical protein ACI9VR_000901 [Cognaticolwellia sp.]|jgi:hypothetical protein